MGLDQYIYTIKKSEELKDFYPATRFGEEPIAPVELYNADADIAYWRKNYYINDFFKNYARKHYEDYDKYRFNCSYTRVTLGMVTELINNIRKEEDYDYDKEYDVGQLAYVAKELESDVEAYYYPWA